jgi:O-antigen ligase
MTDIARDEPRGRAVRFLDGAESLGLVVLLFGLPYSEAMKSLGLALAALGFFGKVVLGAVALRGRWVVLGALGGYVAAAAISVLAARPGFRVPRELFTLATTVAVYPLVLDACARESRRVLFVWALLAGAVVAVLHGYLDYMAASYLRLRLPSIENAVPAAEYMGAVLAMAAALLLAERRATTAGPSVGFVVGAMVIGLLMAKSRGPLVGAAAGALTAVGVGLRRKRVVVGLLAALVVLAWLFASTHPTARVADWRMIGTGAAAATRLENWRQTSALIAERPVTGHGLGSFPRLGVVYHEPGGVQRAENAHQVWLQLACETGLLGCGTFMLFLVLAVGETLTAVRSAGWRLGRAISVGALAGIVALLVAGLFSVTTDAEPGMLFFALVALGVAGRHTSEVGREGG